MSLYSGMIRKLKTADVMCQLTKLYGNRDGIMVEQTTRLTRLIRKHELDFGDDKEIFVLSAPGRIEVVGNHTDHNKGKVLAAAANVDTIALASPRQDLSVFIKSDGYSPITLDLGSLQMRKEEQGSSTALVRGIAARLKEEGRPIGGFNATINSTVLDGSGLSSSAAFEMLIVTIFDRLFGNMSLTGEQRAQIGQYAENVYMGKPTGLMDQMASSLGGLVNIDFKCQTPKISYMEYDFKAKGYAIVVVNTGGNHSHLTDDYAKIRSDMQGIASFFGEENLSRVRIEQLRQEVSELRERVSDRAIMRAMHYFKENRLVDKAVNALKNDNMPDFLGSIVASGRSSFMYLQNVYSTPERQELSLALALAEDCLGEKGAWRVHGGGFAGTTLNFVPEDKLENFIASLEAAFGLKSCQVLDIRPIGATEIVF